MFNDFTAGLSKFFTKQRVFTIFVLIFIAVILMYYANSKTLVVDNMTTGSPIEIPITTNTSIGSGTPVPGAPASYALQPVANPSDLLPSDVNSEWGSLNSLNQSNVSSPDLLQAGYHIGLDTIGQTLRNANLQLRSDPIIPKSDVGPWNQTTIEPDYARVPLEIGNTCH